MELKDLDVMSYRLRRRGWSKHRVYEEEVILERTDDDYWIVKMWHDPSNDYHYLNDDGKFTSDKCFFYSPEDAMTTWKQVPSMKRFSVLKNRTQIYVITAENIDQAYEVAKLNVSSTGLEYAVHQKYSMFVLLPFNEHAKYTIKESPGEDHEDP